MLTSVKETDPVPLTFNAIFLGNTPIRIDPTEGDQDAENANLLVGQTFGSTSDSLAARWVSFTSVNRGGNATALDQNNNTANDRARIDNGSGPVTYTFDATAIYEGVITYMDGTPSATLDLVLVQMTNGDLYLVPSPTANPHQYRPDGGCRPRHHPDRTGGQHLYRHGN